MSDQLEKSKTLENAIEWAKENHESYLKMLAGDFFEVVDWANVKNKPTTPIWEMANSESDYRRGFSHGIAYAVELIDRLKRKGFLRPTEISNIIDDWNRNKVYPWRHAAWENVTKDGLFARQDHPKLKHASWTEIRQRIFLRDGNRCLLCGASENLHADHIIPAVDGGCPKENNLQTLCEECNFRKGVA